MMTATKDQYHWIEWNTIKLTKILAADVSIRFYKSHFSATQNFPHYWNQRWARLRFFEIQTEPEKENF
jgi:hypothetical protein